MAELDKKKTVTLEELMVSTLANHLKQLLFGGPKHASVWRVISLNSNRKRYQK